MASNNDEIDEPEGRRRLRWSSSAGGPSTPFQRNCPPIRHGRRRMRAGGHHALYRPWHCPSVGLLCGGTRCCWQHAPRSLTDRSLSVCRLLPPFAASRRLRPHACRARTAVVERDMKDNALMTGGAVALMALPAALVTPFHVVRTLFQVTRRPKLVPPFGWGARARAAHAWHTRGVGACGALPCYLCRSCWVTSSMPRPPLTATNAPAAPLAGLRPQAFPPWPTGVRTASHLQEGHAPQRADIRCVFA